MITKLEKYGAVYCMPCKAIDKTLNELKQTMPIEIVKFDADEDEEHFDDMNIRSVPTLIFYNENGEEVRRTTGNKTLQQIIDIINDRN